MGADPELADKFRSKTPEHKDELCNTQLLRWEKNKNKKNVSQLSLKTSIHTNTCTKCI
jgi:hypothetical protein